MIYFVTPALMNADLIRGSTSVLIPVLTYSRTDNPLNLFHCVDIQVPVFSMAVTTKLLQSTYHLDYTDPIFIIKNILESY